MGYNDVHTSDSSIFRGRIPENASFTEVKDEQKQEEKKDENRRSNLPVIPIFISDFRHPLLKEKERSEIEKIKQELEVDKDLGLIHQAEITAKKALNSDIDELTKSNEYIQVTKGLLSKIFKIDYFKALCWTSNVKSCIQSFIKDAKAPLLLTLSFLASIPLICWWFYQTAHLSVGPVSVTLFILAIAACAGSITLLCFACKNWHDLEFSWDIIDVDLELIPLGEVKEKVPLGAKLKVLEAQKTGIFEGFVYAHPKFSVGSKEFELKKYLPQVRIDPAILGVTKDTRMFMIVYWDLKKDTERILKNINAFKKLKLQE